MHPVAAEDGPLASSVPTRLARSLGAGGAFLAVLLAFGASPAAASTPDWSLAQPEVVVAEVDMPLDIHVAPDGAVWYATLAGTLYRHDPTTGAQGAVHTVDDVVTGGERGLVGFALAADFGETGAFYLYYTQRTDDPQGGMNRLVRVEGGVETVLASVPGAEEHNGGRIAVAQDGTLFVGTGENQLRDPAQDPKSLLGKILHLTPEGDPVDGNLDGIVYSRGHRNVYGLVLHPETGTPWSTENSGWRRDEVNVIQAKGNYGYPECEGHGLNGVDTPCPTDKGYVFPVRTFYEDKAVAPTGAAFWRGEFYWASLNEGSIHHLWQDPDTQQWMDAIVLEHGVPILDLHAGPDDAFYFSTTDGILRITLPDEDVPPTGGTTQDPGTGGGKPGPGTDGAQPQGQTGKGAPAAAMAAVALALAAAAWCRRR